MKHQHGLCTTTIHQLGVRIGSMEILKGADLQVHCGEITAVIGTNGAGKSTLLRAILGEIPHTGQVTFSDAANKRLGLPSVGYVPQRLDFDYGSPVSVLDLFAAVSSNRPVWLSYSKTARETTREALARVHAEHLMNRRLGSLSGGELQRVLLALALTPIPDLLLLDEPVAGMDRNGLRLFYETVSELRDEYDLSIILVSHDLDLVARHADRVAFLSNETISRFGTPEEVFSDSGVIEAFGLGVLVGRPMDSGGADT
jgi:zinc transport system ATP-binding protein